ncbi:MAG: hypothetical protein KF725_10355 [Cyclobacteriaceae bacterium]|nr:hypothetical protein [Cyclobacteriaceae bacterium]UYN86114.1 MAG: hypothetical protein KIT51_14750 [Cyclobacteriaceae bacterium]
MDSKKLEELLQKYWDCESSLEEEEQLRTYFCGNDVPDQWRETAILFRYFDEQKGKSVDPQFENVVVSQIKSTKRAESGKLVKLFSNTMRIAAGVAVLLAAVYFVRQELRSDSTVAVEDTYDDPQKAFEETKRALLMLSKGFGQAEQQAKKINVFNEAQEKVQTSTTSDNEL